MLAWPKVCRPPELGGLGFLDLQLFIYVLRMRWLSLSRTDDSRPWSQLPDRHESLVQAMFQASISINLGDGNRSFFWTDHWLQGKSIKDWHFSLCRDCTLYPRLVFPLMPGMVAQGLQEDVWIRDITGAVTVQVLLDYLLIWDLTRNVVLHSDVPDRLIWKWTSDQKKENTLQADDNCALCCQASETIAHLLVGCPFSRELWYAILQYLHWQALFPEQEPLCLADWWSGARKKLTKTDHRCFDSIIILISRILWIERNKRVFDRHTRSVQQLLSFVADEAVQWTLAGYKQLVL
ncbi:hypothetical protein PAHAL_6G073800 [Panicum hallii]|uniref:Reverse transcriptase zinc-binding domain-containing protein n=1 Tax=Panicum hallii TaxID=206008 RepID=A0A2T8IFI8_9POAL|nr:hypothetical protein PAHAL_6G073800 [Panicum hallii]